MDKLTRTNLILILSIFFAALLWWIMFWVKPFSFWYMMPVSCTLLILLSLPSSFHILREAITPKKIGLAILSAAVLYLIFFLGNKFLIGVHQLFPTILPDRSHLLTSVYSQGAGSMPRWAIGALLFFPIGFAEEFFWRGYLQRKLQAKLTPWRGFILTTLIYTLVHIPAMNPLLIMAALVCGTFWGYLYMRYTSIWVVILSHALWDPLIFVLFPIM